MEAGKDAGVTRLKWRLPLGPCRGTSPENASHQDPTAGLCLGPDGVPRGQAFCYERCTPVRWARWWSQKAFFGNRGIFALSLTIESDQLVYRRVRSELIRRRLRLGYRLFENENARRPGGVSTSLLGLLDLKVTNFLDPDVRTLTT